MFAKLMHCQFGLAQIDLSGTLMSLDDSTPKNMSQLMALGHKTVHDPDLDNNFITGKLLPSFKLEATRMPQMFAKLLHYRSGIA
jgi:hypothetical protein